MKSPKATHQLAVLVLALGSITAAANGAVPASLEGMFLIRSWTDLESATGELPSNPFGTSDTDGADRIGLFVEFQNGLSGTITYSGVAGLWNSTFSGRSPDTATGFFTAASGLHFLFNDDSTLPIAWEDFTMPFSNNFDLDPNDQNGSHFRASVSGWESATFATYSSTAVPEPSSAALLGLGALALAATRRRSR